MTEASDSGEKQYPPRTPPEKLCDLVMKGGVASGVVYPQAIIALAHEYRFKNIGGASAGAIAASIAAAAELGRESGGFEKLDKLSKEIPKQLFSLFQPEPEFRPIFKAATGALEPTSNPRRIWTVVSSLLSGYWRWTLIGASAGALLGTLIGLAIHTFSGWIGSIVLMAVVGAPLGIAIALVRRVWVALTRQLPGRQFGICSGMPAKGTSGPALTTWLADHLDRLAGLNPDDPEEGPLTFGELHGPGGNKKPAIRLEVMTTCLAEARPYRVPFESKKFMFRKTEFERLFPKRIVRWMVENSTPVRNWDGYYTLPPTEKLPVIVAVRLSLSFPLLLSAVPLYARDYTVLKKENHAVPRLCLFSDGGIASNFPIHFFDSPLPSHPTFAISLEDFDEERHQQPVSMPSSPRAGIQRAIQDVKSLPKFLWSILTAMQDWQDNMRMRLGGYQDRVVSIRLRKDEGGLNLKMDPEVVKELLKRGGEAGALIGDTFDFEAHRWRRYLVWSAALEEALENVLAKYQGTPNYAGFIQRYQPTAYRPTSAAWRDDTNLRTKELVELLLKLQGLRRFQDGSIPRPPSDLGLNPRH